MSAAAIKKQVEFYFSDSNFRKDTFLKTAASEDPEGFVPISVLTTFNKLKSMTTDVATIADAVKDSTSVVVSEDGTRIRRSEPLDDKNDTTKIRTVYIKGFPTEDADVTIDAIAEQFSAYGEVAMVRLRKDFDTKAFRGSAFVEYASEEGVKAAIAAANGENGEVKIGFKGTPFLCVMTLTDWLERKAAKRARNKKGGAKKAEGASLEAAASVSVGEKRKAEDDAAPAKIEFTPGLIIKLDKIPSTATLFNIKDAFKTLGDVRYVEYTNGESSAYIRTGDPASTEKIMTSLHKGMVIPECDSDIKLEGQVLSGEDESNYWMKVASDAKKRNEGRGNGKGGRGGGRGGRGGRGNKKQRR